MFIFLFTVIFFSKLSKEIEDFTKGKIDYLFYFDGIYSNTLFPDVNVSSTPSHIMNVNFKAPVFCFSVLMPFLKKSHGRIATFISHSCIDYFMLLYLMNRC